MKEADFGSWNLFRDRLHFVTWLNVALENNFVADEIESALVSAPLRYFLLSRSFCTEPYAPESVWGPYRNADDHGRSSSCCCRFQKSQ